ncbi:MAG: acyl-CoA dehydrogenase family protein, partial [Verrucomicrobiae bacterium]|nr:acyl-CoA dehydrogenase family protein [Verrucomicrobiae bacterium]
MATANYDVIVVGAGPAGISAAIGLAKKNFSVLAIESGAFPGAENPWGVYFANELADPELLGPAAVEKLPFERRIVRRGLFLCNGHSLAGASLRDPNAFRHAYTCFRPAYDRAIADAAQALGVTLLNATTVTSLIRRHGRVIGVDTSQGPFYAKLVFLAEGDASHLTAKEGYEPAGANGARFLYAITEVIEVEPAQIEKNFGVGPGEGAAFDIFLRNGHFNGSEARLNMRGFLHTNAASVTVGLLMPLENLAAEFHGEPAHLLDWFKSLPDIQHWLGGKPSRALAFGAKLIRDGGLDAMPRLVDNGLAIGGGATGLGGDLPCPDQTGPACATGKLIARAAAEVRRSGSEFTAEALETHYVAPLRRSHYFHDAEYLRRWPAYLRRTQLIFGPRVDVGLGALFIRTSPQLGALSRLRQLATLVRDTLRVLPPTGLVGELRESCRVFNLPHLWSEALSVENAGRWILNTIGLSRKADPRLEWTYRVEGNSRDLPGWLRRLQPHMARAMSHYYRNGNALLEEKFAEAVHEIAGGFSLWFFLDRLAVLAGLAAGVTLQLLGVGLRWILTRRAPSQPASAFYRNWLADVRRRLDLGAGTSGGQPLAPRLATIRFELAPQSHIKLLRLMPFERRQELLESPLQHVCPAGVFRIEADPQGQPLCAVNFENCINCEACWRAANNHVDWGRTGSHRVIYSAPTTCMPHSKVHVPPGPLNPDPWAADAASKPMTWPKDKATVQKLVRQLASKLAEFNSTLLAERRAINANRAQWLQAILSYAESVAHDLDPLVAKFNHAVLTALWQELRRTLQGARAHAAAHKFFWAAADVQQVLHHHLAGLARLLDLPAATSDTQCAIRNAQSPLRARIEAAFDATCLSALEHGSSLPAERRASLRELAAQAVDDVGRCALLAELARRDISLAWLVTEHLLARDLISPDAAGDQWLAIATHGDLQERDGKLHGKQFLVSTALADAFVVIAEKFLYLIPRSAPGLTNRPQQTIGLAGAKFAHLEFEGVAAQKLAETKPRDFLVRRGALDLTAIARGAGGLLLERALAHAKSCVQFAGQFHDGDGRDSIAKFGAVKGLLADMAAQRLLLDTLADRDANASAQEAVLVRLLATGALGCEPGSLAYNAGQVVGGRAYAEDDVFAKFYRDAAILRVLLADEEALKQQAGKVVFQMEHDFGQTLPRITDAEKAELETAIRRGPLARWVEQFDKLRNQLADAVRALPAPPASELVFAHIADAMKSLFATKELLLTIHEQLEAGRAGEAEVEIAKLWAQRTSALIESIPARCAAAAKQAAWGAGLIAQGYPDHPLKQPLKFSYDDLLKAPGAYESGDFLTRTTERGEPRCYPELLRYDEQLRELDRDLHAFFFKTCGARLTDGLAYARHVEKQRTIPEGDLRAFTERGLLRFPIPKTFGGEGRSYADFAVLLRHAVRESEAGVALMIQVHASIGTTPILHALKRADAGMQATPEERDRRRKACVLFLRMIAGGRIAAFALAEAQSGSDAAGIQTRAVLRRVEVFTEKDGTKFFHLDDKKTQRRKLVDAEKWDLKPLPPDTDVAFIRREGAKEFYEFYELTGTKTWVTNARFAGVFCIYARTEQGVTGFMVRRESEGLVIGPDRAKMGLHAAPSCDLTLTAVRVPRECVLGDEGRGQASALETLNVGRVSLAVAATAAMSKIIVQTRAFMHEHHLTQTKWAQSLVAEMAGELFAAESLTHELIGLLDHPGTKSFRIESAIAKLHASEALQRVIRAAERIFGVHAPSAAYELEKHRRDARVLTI